MVTLAIAWIGALNLCEAQDLEQSKSLPAASPYLTTDRLLRASLYRIGVGSALWREASARIFAGGGRVLVVTPSELRTTGLRPGTFDPGMLAETIPVAGRDSRIQLVVVVVNLRSIAEAHNARLSVAREVEADLDRILVHEVYGHAIPYLLAGDLSGHCADPKRGERASTACSIRRENAVRAELGLGHRDDYGLESLRLARGVW